MNGHNLELVLDYARHFLGYGNPSSPYWFVGLEEAGVQQPEQAVHRAHVWNGNGFMGQSTVDLQDYSQQVGAGQWFVEHPNLQRTWQPLIRFLLAVAPNLRVNGNEGAVTNEEIRNFQRDHWGRANSNTCLLELFGLPKASGGPAWPYAGVPRIGTRELGTVETFNQRKQALQAVLQAHEKNGSLKIVLFYARGDCTMTLWSDVCDIQDWNVGPILNGAGDFLCHRRNKVLFLGIKHPSRGRIGNVQEDDFMPTLAQSVNQILQSQ